MFEDEKPLYSMILKGGNEFEIYEDLVKIYERTFPMLNVRQELQEIETVFLTLPKKRKATKMGVKKFIVSWLQYCRRNKYKKEVKAFDF